MEDRNIQTIRIETNTNVTQSIRYILISSTYYYFYYSNLQYQNGSSTFSVSELLQRSSSLETCIGKEHDNGLYVSSSSAERVVAVSRVRLGVSL